MKTVLILTAADGGFWAFAYPSDAAAASAGHPAAIIKAIVASEDDLANSSLSGGDLVKVYNAISAKPYEGGNRFTNRGSGVKRVWKLLDAMVVSEVLKDAPAPAQAAPVPEPEAEFLATGQSIKVAWPGSSRGFDAGAFIDKLFAAGLKPDAMQSLLTNATTAGVNEAVINKVNNEMAKRSAKATKAAAKAAKATARANKPAKVAKPKSERKPREGTIKDKVLGMMRRQHGASAAEIMEETKWQPHSLRGFVSTQRKLHAIETSTSEKRGTVYKLAAE